MADLSAGSKICNNCGQDINVASFLVHEAFCFKNFIKCDICNKAYDKNLKNEHFENFHSKIKCICGNLIHKYHLEFHQKEDCKKRQVKCTYCDLTLDFEKINQHQENCGSRTELCDKCRKYVMIKDKLIHEISNCSEKEKSPRKNYCQKQELVNPRRPASSLNVFPCEFCSEQFVGFEKLIEHQVFCQSNYLDDLCPGKLRNFSDDLDDLEQELEEMSFYPKENEISSETNRSPEFSLVPCEFCDEYIDFNLYNQHMEHCDQKSRIFNQVPLDRAARSLKNKETNRPKTLTYNTNPIRNSNFRRNLPENNQETRIPPRNNHFRNTFSKNSKNSRSNNHSDKK